MKKIWKYAILLVALSALLCMSAFAVDSPDCPDVTILDKTNAEVWVKAGYESFGATYKGTVGSQYLIIMLESNVQDKMPDPTVTKILYVNQAQAGEDGVVEFDNVYPSTVEDSVIWLTGGTDGPVALASIKAPEKQGVTVSGTVTSYLNDTDTVTVELWADGATEAAYIASGTGMTYAYSVTGVASGTYTLKVSKTNHVTREYTITVGETAVTQDAKIHPRGDINGDGSVTTADNTLMLRHIKNIKLITDEYQFACADLNSDRAITTADNTLMLRHVKEIKMLW